MHKLVIGIPDETAMGDHINRNRLDNRRSNLRVATDTQNCRNSGIRSHNTTGYKGVAHRKHSTRWWARIVVDGKFIYLGQYDTAEEAALAYNKAAIKYFGEFASPNKL